MDEAAIDKDQMALHAHAIPISKDDERNLTLGLENDPESKKLSEEALHPSKRSKHDSETSGKTGSLSKLIEYQHWMR